MPTCKDCLHIDVCEIRTCYMCNGFACDDCEIHSNYGKIPSIKNCKYFKDRNRVMCLPCKVKDIIDKVVNTNESIAIWEIRKNKEGNHKVLLWRGMAWDIPKEHLERTFLNIFGAISEVISESDTINIAVVPVLKSLEK